MPAVPLKNLDGLSDDLPGAAQRIANSTHLGTDYSVDDPNDLTQTGWGVIFASDADPAIKAQLQPLLDLRQQQVQDPKLFKVYEGTANGGVLPGQTAASWAQQRGVSLTAPVDPYQGGVPYYLLIVGSPARIPFEFQALLKMQWAVGRLAFDDVEDYGRYAQAVVQYESPTFHPVQRKNAAVWVTRNYGDLGTAMLSGAICQDFLAPANQLGSRRQFNLDAFPNEKATKAQLTEILRGNLPGGPPAVFFTGSHGCDYSGADSATQSRLQGSLATQEWMPGTPASTANQFSADDIPADAKLQGTMGFLFACYSGGCPTDNNYYFKRRRLEDSPRPRSVHRAAAPGHAQPRRARHHRPRGHGIPLRISGCERNPAGAGHPHAAGDADAGQARRPCRRFAQHFVELALGATGRGPGVKSRFKHGEWRSHSALDLGAAGPARPSPATTRATTSSSAIRRPCCESPT